MRAWVVWGIAPFCLTAYSVAGWVASRTHLIDVELKTGATAQLTVFSLFEYRPPLRLFLRSHECEQRPELGRSYSNSEDWRETGFVKFRDPGADVELALSDDQAAPVLFQTMPLSGCGSDIN